MRPNMTLIMQFTLGDICSVRELCTAIIAFSAEYRIASDTSNWCIIFKLHISFACLLKCINFICYPASADLGSNSPEDNSDTRMKKKTEFSPDQIHKFIFGN